MSVRAYKVLSYSEDASFNCWHDDRIMDIAETSEDGGTLSLEKTAVEDLAEKLAYELKEDKELTQEQRDDVQHQLEHCQDMLKTDFAKKDYCDYICY